MIAGILVSLASGFAATKVMDYFTTWMYKVTPEADRKREGEVQSRASYVVAAEKMAPLVGRTLDTNGAERVGNWFHWGLGLSFGAVYVIVRILTGWDPNVVAMGVAMFMFVVIDEIANTVLGFAAPPQRFPLWTHARGFFGHIVYGIAVAFFAENLLPLVGVTI